MSLSVGDPAPEFVLPATRIETLKSGDCKGRKLVLFFYPKDDTSGCTAEAIAFSGMADLFAAEDALVIGISPDSMKSHEKFAAKHDLKVPLASDEAKEVLQAFGVWVEKSMYGKKYMGVERSTFLIDSDGRIANAWRKVKVPGHADEVLAAVKAL